MNQVKFEDEGHLSCMQTSIEDQDLILLACHIVSADHSSARAPLPHPQHHRAHVFNARQDSGTKLISTKVQIWAPHPEMQEQWFATIPRISQDSAACLQPVKPRDV